MSPRPQIDHIRKPQLLAAAADVIAERGVAATRIADIAERAGTSGPAVLYWFESKDDLLAEALTLEEERFHSVISEHLAALEDPRERLSLLICASAADCDLTLWMEIWTRALRDDQMLAARKQLDDHWRALIEAIVRDGQESGAFAPVDPEEASLVIASLLDGLAVQATLGDPSVPQERMCDLAIRVAEGFLQCDLPPTASAALAQLQAAVAAGDGVPAAAGAAP